MSASERRDVIVPPHIFKDVADPICHVINRKCAEGHNLDTVLFIIAATVADIGRARFGPEFLKDLADIVTVREHYPVPGEANSEVLQ